MTQRPDGSWWDERFLGAYVGRLHARALAADRAARDEAARPNPYRRLVAEPSESELRLMDGCR